MALFKKFTDSRDAPGEDDRISDIIENLNHILNTKKGYGSMLKDFGVRDLNEFNDKNGIAAVIIQEVMHSVAEYEPRVNILNMVKEDRAGLFQLTFRIECVIRKHRQEINLVFDTVGSRFLVETRKNR